MIQRFYSNLIRKGELHFKTDLSYFVEGGIWLLLSHTVSVIATFLLAVAFANLLPKEVYGTYRFVLSVLGILTILTLPGMNIALTRAIAKGQQGFYTPAVKEKIRWGLWAGLLSLLLAVFYLLVNNVTLAMAFLVVSVFVPFMDSFAAYGSFLQGMKRFQVFSLYRSLSFVVATGVMVALVFATNNVITLLFAYLALWTFLHAAFFWMTSRKAEPHISTTNENLSYGKHLSITTAISVVASHLDLILVFQILGGPAVAVYVFATAPIEQLRGLLKVIGTLALPKFSEREPQIIKRGMIKKMFIFGLSVAPLVILYILAAPFLYNFLFPQYTEAILLSQIFAITLFAVAGRLPLVALQSQAAKEELRYAAALGALVEIILLLILIFSFGLLGALFAKIFSRFFNMVVGWLFVKKSF